MIRNISCIALFTLLMSCNSGTSLFSKKQKLQPLLDLNTYLLDGVAKDATYGYSQENPIKVGGAFNNQDVVNQHRYLNALTGKNGEKVYYTQTGTCCYYDLPEGSTEKLGMLERYELSIKETGFKTIIYINSYERDKLLAPRGFLYKK